MYDITISLIFLPFLCYFVYDFAYNIIYISYEICYDISMLWYYSWHQSIYAMIWPSDISMSWYDSHVISWISWYVPLYHGTCAAVWRGLGPQLGAPAAPPPPASPSPPCWGVSGDCCSAEQRRPGSRAWTCCSDNVVAAAKFQVEGGNFQVGPT